MDAGTEYLLLDKFIRELIEALYELYPNSKIEEYEDYSLDSTIIIITMFYKGKLFKIREELQMETLRSYLQKNYAELLLNNLQHFQREITNFILSNKK